MKSVLSKTAGLVKKHNQRFRLQDAVAYAVAGLAQRIGMRLIGPAGSPVPNKRNFWEIQPRYSDLPPG